MYKPGLYLIQWPGSFLMYQLYIKSIVFSAVRVAAGRQETFSRRYGQRHRHRQPTVPGHPGESCGPVGSDQSKDSAGYKQICLERSSFHCEMQMMNLFLVCVCSIWRHVGESFEQHPVDERPRDRSCHASNIQNLPDPQSHIDPLVINLSVPPNVCDGGSLCTCRMILGDQVCEWVCVCVCDKSIILAL